MARLVWFIEEAKDKSEEAILIDSQGMSKKELEEEYGLPVKEIVEISDDCMGWPTDRLMVQG